MSKKHNIDECLYNAFWSKLEQAKFDIVYFNIHFNRCIKVSRVLKYLIVGVTALATGAWITWSNVSFVGTICAILIWFFQAISAIAEWFPYEKRKVELHDMVKELEPLYIEMENEWRNVQSGKISNKQVQERLVYYETKQMEIKNHYFKNDALPEREGIRKKADDLTEEYFKFFK